MRWAFVPLKPNALTPARARTVAAAHGLGSTGTVTDIDAQSMCGRRPVEVQVGRDLARAAARAPA